MENTTVTRSIPVGCVPPALHHTGEWGLCLGVLFLGGSLSGGICQRSVSNNSSWGDDSCLITQSNQCLISAGSFLPPANEVCEGYVFTSVCQSLCSQEGVSTWAGNPPGRYTPLLGPGTPPLGRYTPGTRYTPQAGTHPFWDQVHPPWDQVHPPGTRYTPRAVHAGRYGQQVDSMHPTGMHSC